MSMFLSLGSNIGNRQQNLQNAINMLRDELAVKIDFISNIYETEPFGATAQAWFYNIVCHISTDIIPCNFILLCKSIEYALGRRRSAQWSDRIIDIDILLWRDIVLQNGTLTVPHAFLSARRFVLVPLCDIAPNCVHPVLLATAWELLQNCEDTSIVKKTNYILD